MNSRERFLAALRGEVPDRTPLACVAALTPVELQQRTGCWMPEVHHDPEKLVRLCAANHEVLGFDGVSFIINYFNEPAALAADMCWGGPRQLPSVASGTWRRPEDAVIPRDLLDRAPLRGNLEALRLARKLHGERAAVLGKVMGPFSMTQMMHGIEDTVLGLFDDPPRIRGFLDVCVEILVRSANAQLEAGAEAVLIGEGGAGAQMLSPAMYQDFLMEPHRRMVRSIEGPTILHICGDITPRLSALSRIGFTCFNFDWAIAPRAMKQAAAGAFRIMGNVNTTDLLRASPDAIQQQVGACLDAGVDIISPGCAVSPDCPVTNFQAMTAAVEMWSRGREKGTS